MPKSYYWLLFALGAWAAVFLLVPREKLKRLWSVGFWGGLVLTVVIQIVAIRLLGLWKFNYMLFPILGFDLFLPFMWFAETILFVNFMPKELNARLFYITAVAAATTLMGYFFYWSGVQSFIRWNLFYTFLLALASHFGIAYAYLASENRLTMKR